MWKSVIYSPANGLATQIFGHGKEIDWLGNQSFLIRFGENYGISKNFVAILVAIAWRHTGYIMVLYLAGLKSVDNSLREAAMLDGSNEWQTFRHVVFPSLKPINVVIAVDHRDRGAAGIRHHLRAQYAPQDRSALDPDDEQPARRGRRQRRPRLGLRDDPLHPLLRLRDLVRHQPLPARRRKEPTHDSGSARGCGPAAASPDVGWVASCSTPSSS